MTTNPDPTHTYYQANAERFFNETVAVDMAELQDRFLALVPPGGLILDAGCGSGRDSRVFLDRGYRVCAFDAVPELATLAELAAASWRVLQRRPSLSVDLPERLRNIDENEQDWLRYWRGNPVNAWIGGNRAKGKNESPFFALEGDRFVPAFVVSPEQRGVMAELVQELVDYRLAAYVARKRTGTGKTVGDQMADDATTSARRGQVIPLPQRQPEEAGTDLPYFPNLKIACGHFRTGRADATEYRRLGAGYGHLDPARHFIARATGNSMDGGSRPIRDGDYLLLERMSPQSAGSITGQTLVIERQESGDDNQYLLRKVVKTATRDYLLRANNPAYPDLTATEEMITRARLKAVIGDPGDLAESEI